MRTYKCNTCNKYFEESVPRPVGYSCAVNHGPNYCCHYPDYETKAPVEHVELLTKLEDETADLLSDVYQNFKEISGPDNKDLMEIVFHIHALQNHIMAQAAARAYPDDYRLIGCE